MASIFYLLSSHGIATTINLVACLIVRRFGGLMYTAGSPYQGLVWVNELDLAYIDIGDRLIAAVGCFPPPHAINATTALGCRRF